ncbi:PAS domain-containing hybrid sensor histidine kinase/response regulator [Algoriphagus boritolerans]|uniref:Sensory/regulatory protein RpfC n=1 Tax=Algoriphagus boritolerans DSM 17298 = JCM 18970 TaxID=1120964 RepID=A0A1H5Y966_9BACT|nr:PAS domain-containing hybrid sensor histidine kinase/response regulator [Algoriphagus boritolerans]SEG20130.1 PAS domain S-box-containing protein [Algoriphagus boritolerans DSM 17298 = JCM 18970]
MGKRFVIRSSFWLITIIGSLLVLLVIALGISFFNAIYYAQVESRKEFLISQTTLAARGLEVDLSRFKEDSKTLLVQLEGANLKTKDDLTVAARRTFTSFPGMIDSIWVDMRDSILVFTMTDRNDFISKKSKRGFPKAVKRSQLLVEGKEGFRILYSLNIPSYSQTYVTNFYLNPGGEKYLFMEGNLVSVGSRRTEDPVSLDKVHFDQIKSDVNLGLKGFYEVSWNKGDKSFEGILAQYPFSYAEAESPASLVFFVPMEGLTSGFYSTYLALFLGLVILLIGTVSFFILSLKGNINSIKLQEANLYEISRLFDQQNLLLQELKGFVFFHDYHGEITKVSDEVEKVLGHSKLDFKNAFKADSIHPQANLVKAEAKKALAESRDFMDLEYDFAKPTGEKIRVRIFEKFIFDQQGRFSGGMGICTDITSQYLARQETIQSENRLRTVISNIPDTIFIYDNEGVVLDFHVQDKANLLHPAQLTLGKSLAEFVPHGQADEIVRVFNLAKSTNRIQTKDVVWHSPSGDKHYEMRFFPLDENQVMSISKDITGQKIWERGLVEAMNAADQANRSKSEFLANMSHEIRTPMNGLLGIIDLLESTNLNKIQKQYVEIIKNSGSSLLNIIRDILDYSKIESGKIEIQSSAFIPEEELKNQLKILSGLAAKKNIKLETTFVNSENLLFEGDKGKINQVLLNLIGNAIKFTPDEGKVGVKMELTPIEDALYFLSFQISDTGIGIPKEHLERLADPFYQVESSNTRAYQGTGLGLAIAKKIIELLGGEFRIESKLGEGSVFSFSVVVRKSEQNQITPKSYQLTWKDIKDMGTVFPLRILLAEDNDLNLQLMTFMFQQLGFQFEVAKNGAEVLDKVKQQQFDVILMDVQMPVMNGLEATREIRKMEGTDQMIIIGLSANVFEEDQKKAIESGMNDYLTKPIRLAALADKLEFYFRKVREKAE